MSPQLTQLARESFLEKGPDVNFVIQTSCDNLSTTPGRNVSLCLQTLGTLTPLYSTSNIAAQLSTYRLVSPSVPKQKCLLPRVLLLNSRITSFLEYSRASAAWYAVCRSMNLPHVVGWSLPWPCRSRSSIPAVERLKSYPGSFRQGPSSWPK